MTNASMKTGSTVPVEEQARKESQTKAIFKRLLKNKSAMLGALVLILLVLMAVFAPYIAPYGYEEMDSVNKFLSPCAEHILGTDEYGRDLFSRVVYGARYSLTLGFFSALFSVTIGTIIGAVAGYFGGRVDYLIMRFLDVFQSIPVMLMTICVATALGNGLFNTILAMGVGGMAGSSRLVRATVMSIRTQEYLEASTAINCRQAKIIFKHVLPNAISPVIVQFTMSVGGNILGASGLSYIGLGVQPPMAEWGALMVAGAKYIRNYPYLIIFPGIFVALTVLAANMFGDGLRDAMDPKLKN